MEWEKLKPIEGGHGSCLHCGYQHDVLPMDSVIAVGFGSAVVTKNNKLIYSGPSMYQEPEPADADYWTVQRAEDEALKDPDNDWRISLIAPLSERHYQRQGDGHWVLYEKGQGFA